MEGLTLNEAEQKCYAELFAFCDVESTKKLAAGSKVAELFRAAQLSNDMLMQITDLCGAKRLGYFGRSQFYIALKLIAVSQAGLPVRLESIGTVHELPRFTIAPGEAESWHTAQGHYEHEGPQGPYGSAAVLPPPPGRVYNKKLHNAQELPSTGPATTQRILEKQMSSKSPPQEQTSPAVSPQHTPPGSPTGWHPATERGQPVSWKPFTERSMGSGEGNWPVGSATPQQDSWVSFTNTRGVAAVDDGPAPPAHHVTVQSDQTPARVATKDAQQRMSYSDDPWRITEEQRDYYINQFKTIQHDLAGLIPGSAAKEFFTKSKLPIMELSHIWELSDFDQDGALTLDEFCAAFHLVVARKNGYDLPERLPETLIPKLIDIDDDKDVSEKHSDATFASSPVETVANKSPSISQTWVDLQQNSEQWETFSDRSSSCQTLTRFDTNITPADPETAIVHPVAIRMTPSKIHLRDMDLAASGQDASPPAKLPCAPSAADEATAPAKFAAKNNDGFHSSESAHSSDVDPSSNDSSRPRSFSGTSGEDSKRMAPPPPPPPRPHQTHSRSSSLDLNKAFAAAQQGQTLSGASAPPPAVPPRPHPHVLQSSKSVDGADLTPGPVNPLLSSQPPPEQPNFADFTHFAALQFVPEAEREAAAKEARVAAQNDKHIMKVEGQVDERNTSSKKPSRHRMKSEEESRAEAPAPEEHFKKTGGIAALGNTQPALQRSAGKEKKAIQASIRKNKETNTVLARLNTELNQQLKDLLEERIALEVQLEQLRPFSHT
uniref:RalBP1-associated Eps domain-containing protein 1 n=1 Tax=Eptatretus burgeri TaxID=7764 RepID=A0A8C4QN09_EPTBU